LTSFTLSYTLLGFKCTLLAGLPARQIMGWSAWLALAILGKWRAGYFRRLQMTP